MKQIGLYVAGVLVSFGILLAPLSASALGISFGGRIVTMTACLLGGFIHIDIVPAAGGSPNISYIWTPGTIGLPPVHPGQAILGVGDVPIVCAVALGAHPIFWAGQRIQLDGVSI